MFYYQSILEILIKFLLQYLSTILDYLTGDDVRHLTQAEDELTVIGKFERIFPTSQTYKYLYYMDVSYYNRLFDAWETSHECNRKRGLYRYHLIDN